MNRFYQDSAGRLWPEIEQTNRTGSELKIAESDTVDASHEKHVPVVEVEGERVHVFIGSVPHPMLDVHHIEFIAVYTDKGLHVRHLQPGEKPEAEFVIPDEKALVVYEYCNIHGLWKKDL